jgi:hypothetical protein
MGYDNILFVTKETNNLLSYQIFYDFESADIVLSDERFSCFLKSCRDSK